MDEDGCNDPVIDDSTRVRACDHSWLGCKWFTTTTTTPQQIDSQTDSPPLHHTAAWITESTRYLLPLTPRVQYNLSYTWTSTGPIDLSSKRLVKDSHVSFSYRFFFYSDWSRSHCSKYYGIITLDFISSCISWRRLLITYCSCTCESGNRKLQLQLTLQSIRGIIVTFLKIQEYED